MLIEVSPCLRPRHDPYIVTQRISEALALGKMVLLPTRSIPLVKEFAMTTLRTRMMEDMQVRNLSRHTQDSYLWRFRSSLGISLNRRICSARRISAFTRSI